MGHYVEAAFGRDLLAALGNQSRKLRPHVATDRDHLRVGRELEIELSSNGFTKQPHVALGDVPPVLAKMEHDAVGARGFAQRGRKYGIRE